MIGSRKPQRSSTTLGSPWTFDQIPGSPVTSEGLASSSCRKTAQATTSAFISGIAPSLGRTCYRPTWSWQCRDHAFLSAENLSCQGMVQFCGGTFPTCREISGTLETCRHRIETCCCQGTITMPDPGGGSGNFMGAPSAGVTASLSEVVLIDAGNPFEESLELIGLQVAQLHHDLGDALELG